MSTSNDDAFERARELQAAAAELGFDWPDVSGILDKVAEELSELRDAVGAAGPQATAEELGDLLFVLVNLARRLDIAPAQALATACDKFEQRFAFISARLAERGLNPAQVPLDELERLWQLAKQAEDRITERLPKPL